ncbi:hypothetical protein [uncultured Dysosmobacter sp.]|uniref:hypothetical protein n=1 Tax=uncultured Dysosmobacter sp. TaxID=2591384 RepID=UPI00261FA4BF|nr:hypothetical protein [uncultured Dysosmobacter sp.]
MAKKYYPGGFRLTLKTARALAAQELGTAKGLAQTVGVSEGFFSMCLGKMRVRIQPDMRNLSGRVMLALDMQGAGGEIVKFYDRETLEEDFDEEYIYSNRLARETVRDWVLSGSLEGCHQRVDEIWNKG